MLFALVAFFLLSGPPDQKGFLVITSIETPLTEVKRAQLRQIYLKKRDRLRGVLVTPLQLTEANPLRGQFEQELHSKHFNVDEYWQQQRLQGGEKPPLEVTGEAVMLVYLERNVGYIGYVSAGKRDALKGFKVKILTLLD